MADGQFIEVLISDESSPEGMAIDSDGFVYVFNTNDPEGQLRAAGVEPLLQFTLGRQWRVAWQRA